MALALAINLDGFRREQRMALRASEIVIWTVDVGDYRDLDRADQTVLGVVAASAREKIRQRVRPTVERVHRSKEDPVDVLTSDLAEDLPALLTAATVEPYSPGVCAMREAFCRAAKAACCGWCGASPSCAGYDPHLYPPDVEMPPCLRQCRALIDEAGALVEQIYREALPSLEAHVTVNVRLCQNAPSRDAVDGTTTYKVNGGRMANVELKLPEDLAAPTYFSLVYVAAHEFGVHAVQEWLRPGLPAGVRGRFAFAEGFVDEAVHRALTAHLQKAAAAEKVRALYATEPRRTARFDDTMKDIDWPSELRRGKSAFTTLLRLGDKAVRQLDAQASAAEAPPTAPGTGRGRNPSEPPLSAELWAVRAALALNVAELNEFERDHVIRLLRELAIVEGARRKKGKISAEGELILLLEDLAAQPGDAGVRGKLLGLADEIGPDDRHAPPEFF